MKASSGPHASPAHEKGWQACAGKANGILRAWLDDLLVFQTAQAILRESDVHLIEKVALHIYHGGSNSLFEPPQDQWIWYALLLIIQFVVLLDSCLFV
jgi:hypothetical protein